MAAGLLFLRSPFSQKPFIPSALLGTPALETRARFDCLEI